MNDRRLGCIADDVTGATDLASMLARGGYRVVQCFGVPDSSAEDELSHADVIVVALKSRSVPADQAVAMSLSALAFLHSQSIQHVYFKYCSTFDSTPAGNIGPVADALAEACHADDVIFCPAFPENGRTVINGQLLVHGVPIDQTGMRHHPLNPMTDADLVRVLQAQSNRNVVREDMPADATHGNNAPRKPVHRIVDAQDDSDLKRIAQSAAEHRLMTGGSAVASYWADIIGIRKSGADANRESPSLEMPAVILAGSCSEATRDQIAAFAEDHNVLRLTAQSISTLGTTDIPCHVDAIMCWWQACQSTRPSPCLIASSDNTSGVEAMNAMLASGNASDWFESLFAEIARKLSTHGVRRFVIAGGETSGAVVKALAVHTVDIGCEIAPGVPWIRSRGETPFELVLKSGNFGDRQFFQDALETTP